jgi:3-dehydroquinate dehydratase II
VRIAVLHGPNLNLLGIREPELYGSTTLDEIDDRLRALGRELGAEVECFQHNHEGALVDKAQSLHGVADGAVVNAGAFSHSSLALRDALVGVGIPFVEVHVTNIFGREPERRTSVLASAAIGVIAGLGPYGYELALRGLLSRLSKRE